MTPQQDHTEQAIHDFERAGEEYASAYDLERVLHDGKPGVQEQAVGRLMTATETPGQPLTVKPPRATSVSAAEKLVHTDPQFTAYQEQQRKAVNTKNRAWVRMIAARLRAQSALLQQATEMPEPEDDLGFRDVERQVAPRGVSR